VVCDETERPPAVMAGSELKIYLAGVKRAYRDAAEGHHILVSFAQIGERSLITEGWSAKGWLLDSGAFSVWRRGVVIDLNDYMAFCHEHLEKIRWILRFRRNRRRASVVSQLALYGRRRIQANTSFSRRRANRVAG
jgi:hypothetical protein